MTKITTTVIIPDDKVDDFLQKQQNVANTHSTTIIVQSQRVKENEDFPEGTIKTGVLLNESTRTEFPISGTTVSSRK